MVSDAMISSFSYLLPFLSKSSAISGGCRISLLSTVEINSINHDDVLHVSTDQDIDVQVEIIKASQVSTDSSSGYTIISSE
jgi:hypothetical protein